MTTLVNSGKCVYILIVCLVFVQGQAKASEFFGKPDVMTEKTTDKISSLEKIAWWKFEDNFLDSVDSHDASLVGNVTYVDGITGRAAHFGGSGYLTVPDNDEISAMEQFAVDAWIRVTQEKAAYPLFNKYGYSNYSDDEWIFALNPSRVPYLGVFSGPYGGYCDTVITATSTLSIGDWHHVVSVFDNVNHIMEIYVDDILEATRTAFHESLRDTDQPLQIGSYKYYYTSSREYFFGDIDELILWGKSSEVEPTLTPSPTETATQTPTPTLALSLLRLR